MNRTVSYLALAVLAVSCSRSPSAPAEKRVTLEVVGTNIIYSMPGTAVPEPLRVVALDASTHVPVKGVNVTWSVVQGAGTVTPAPTGASTDIDGVAAATFTPGPLGTYRVRASSDRMNGTAPEFEVRAVATPTVDALEPVAITAGGSVVVRGTNFSATAAHNAVLFDGVRGTIQSASTTELRVTVPACLPSRDVRLKVSVGFVSSVERPVTATGVGGQTITLTPGQSRTFTDQTEFACMRLPASAGAQYLLTTHNVGGTHAPPIPFELRALNAGGVATIVNVPHTVPTFAETWETQLRMRERELSRAPYDTAAERAALSAARAQRVPVVGAKASFNVLTPTNTFHKVTATARIISTRALIYVDDETPANGFTEQDLRRFGDLFDDPIYPTDVGVFGEPSDIDANQRIIILFTPRINALTPRGENSFAAGYFYGCDLIGRSRCSGSNLGEVFYSMVPDPDAVWSDRRTAATVLEVVPPVLAHEVQHMIQFARRGQTTDALWLAEALAHTAEELVGDVLQASGATSALVTSFKRPNLQRAQRYLSAPAGISMLAESTPGTLELRGSAWLFLHYLRGHYGGNDLLFRLTGSTRNGVASVTQETGQVWGPLVRDFGIALWADGAPGLAAPVTPLQTFRDFDPRLVLATFPPGFTLQPTPLTWGEFFAASSVATASQAHFLLQAPVAGGNTLNLVLSGARGESIGAGANFTILRVR